MGSDQSRESGNGQRNSSRNFTEAEVRKALDIQKLQLEREMNDLLRSQAASAWAQDNAPSTGSSARTQRDNQTPNNLLERERTSYSYIPNNLAHNVTQSRAPLYPTLPDNRTVPGNNNYSSQNPVNNYVLHDRQYGPNPSPSAPPMASTPARQGRPVSRPRQNPESEDVACPTCRYRYTEKIFNCETGHASCSDCMVAQQPCGKCGRRISDMRNITMEEYVTQKQISCPNANEGCNYTLAPDGIERHLKDCPFKEVQCMMPGDICRWKGKLSKLADHFDQSHPVCRGEIDTEKFLQLNNAERTVQLIKLGSYNFLIHQNTLNNKVYIAAQLIGTKGSASKWCYELHVFKKAEPRRKYVFVDKCFSTGDSFDDVVKNSACAVLPIEYVKTFDNGSGFVVYKYYLKKEADGGKFQEERKRDVSCTRGGRGRGRFRGRGRGNAN